MTPTTKAPTTFYTSDTHFGHKRIIDLCKRPFRGVDHMNEQMIERWNSVVAPTDRVFHLGDVALGTLEQSLPLVGRLNGHKILVPGNHDRIFSGMRERDQRRFRVRYRDVFQQIWPEQNTVEIGGISVNMSHFPYDGDSHGENRWVDKRMKDDGKVIVHGHVHEEFVVRGRQINVGVDAWDFMPVHEDQLAIWIREALDNPTKEVTTVGTPSTLE